MTQQLSGILTALATPFTADDRIDETLLRRLVDRSIDGGVAGVVACGSTGEFAAMSGAERRLLVETVVDQAAGRVPVVAQTGAVSTREAVELSRHAESVGASVLMVVAPYYEPLTLDETLTYLRTVAAGLNQARTRQNTSSPSFPRTCPKSTPSRPRPDAHDDRTIATSSRQSPGARQGAAPAHRAIESVSSQSARRMTCESVSANHGSCSWRRLSARP